MARSEELSKQIDSLEKQLQDYKVELSKLLSCIHEWGEVVFDPEVLQVEVRNPGIQELSTTLAAQRPVVVTRPETKQRWSRTCIRCGEKEYTYETKAVKFEPFFR